MPLIRRANATFDDFVQGRDMSSVVRREDNTTGLIVGFVEDADVDPQDEVISQGDYDIDVATLATFNVGVSQRDPEDYERRSLRKRYMSWKKERNALQGLVDDGVLTVPQAQPDIDKLQEEKAALDIERAAIGI